MGKTSSKVKDRYNKKTYDLISLRVKKGKKEEIVKKAEKFGLSLNSYIVSLIDRDCADEDEV